MLETMSYAQPLRAIGQALELLNIESFDMEPDGEDFLVRGKVVLPAASAAEQPEQESTLRHIWGLLPGRRTPQEVAQMDLRYSPKDLDRLEEEGQARRNDPVGMANAASVSQLLRTIGAYLSQRRARLLKVSRHGQSVTVQYETSMGQKNEETLALSELYDVWVHMYLKRASRSDH